MRASQGRGEGEAAAAQGGTKSGSSGEEGNAGSSWAVKWSVVCAVHAAMSIKPLYAGRGVAWIGLGLSGPEWVLCFFVSLC